MKRFKDFERWRDSKRNRIMLYGDKDERTDIYKKVVLINNVNGTAVSEVWIYNQSLGLYELEEKYKQEYKEKQSKWSNKETIK